MCVKSLFVLAAEGLFLLIRGKIGSGEKEMLGYRIVEELYTTVGHRTTICVLVLENGFEITGTHCLEVADLVHEEGRKQKAFQEAYNKYLFLINAFNRQAVDGKSPFYLRSGSIGSDMYGQESV